MENINIIIIYVLIGIILGQALLSFINAYLMFFPIRGRQVLSIIYLVLAAVSYYADIWVASSFLFLTSILTLGTAIVTERKLESQQLMIQEYMNQQKEESINESERASRNAEPGPDDQEIKINENNNSST